jgi:hypothetical protein
MDMKINKDLVLTDKNLARNANTDNMGKLLVTVFAFAPARKTNS